jgi:hypothetical protein
MIANPRDRDKKVVSASLNHRAWTSLNHQEISKGTLHGLELNPQHQHIIRLFVLAFPAVENLF